MAKDTRDSWTGADGYEDPSRLTHDVCAWYTRSIVVRFSASQYGVPCIGNIVHAHVTKGETTVDALVSWFVERIRDFATWTNHDKYHGDGYSAGAWTIDWDKVQESIQAAVDDGVDAARRAQDAAHCADLDAWLRADIAGTLAFAGAIGGSASLDPATRWKLGQAAKRRRGRQRKQTTQLCVCGDTFVPARANGIRCPKCLANARAFRLGRVEGLAIVQRTFPRP